MALTLSSTLADEVLDLLFGGAALTLLPATDWTVRIYLGHPFNGGSELTGTGYAPVTYPLTAWLPASEGKLNNAELRFPATGGAGGNWPATPVSPETISYLVLCDGAVPLVALLGYRFGGVPHLVISGDWVEIDPGALRVAWTVFPDTQPLAMSAAIRHALLDYLVSGVAWTPPANWEAALWRGSPYAGGQEVSDPDYARITTANDATFWQEASAGISNLAALRWPASGTPAREWGLVTHLCFCLPGGSASVAIALGTPVTPRPGVPLNLAIGDVSVFWQS